MKDGREVVIKIQYPEIRRMIPSDLGMLRAAADAVSIPVIASGGGGSAEDLARALDDGPEGGHCQAALAASIFHFHETTVPEVKRELIELGIPVRKPSSTAG